MKERRQVEAGFGSRLAMIRKALGPNGEGTSKTLMSKLAGKSPALWGMWENEDSIPPHPRLVAALKRAGAEDPEALATWAATGRGEPPSGPHGSQVTVFAQIKTLYPHLADADRYLEASQHTDDLRKIRAFVEDARAEIAEPMAMLTAQKTDISHQMRSVGFAA